MRTMLTVIALTLILAASPPVLAVKKCVDEAGNVTFTAGRSCAAMGGKPADVQTDVGAGASAPGTGSGTTTTGGSGAAPAGGQGTSRYNQADRARRSGQQYGTPRTMPE